MAKFVRNITGLHWVVYAPKRTERPGEGYGAPNQSGSANIVGSCVFCPGNENLNTELFRIGGETGDANWKIRVITNKFPITDVHEVIIHSPDHARGIADLDLEQVKTIVMTYRQRYNYHFSKGEGQVLIFNNHDAHAGASIKHPHSQLVVVPKEIKLEEIIKEPVMNVISDAGLFDVYCPDFSQWPYEVWVAPKRTGLTFGQINDEEVAELAMWLKKILTFIHQKFNQPGVLHKHSDDPDVPFNYYIYHGKDWYLRIIPRLVHPAGLELGTGLSVNIVEPEKAAEDYRLGLAS